MTILRSLFIDFRATVRRSIAGVLRYIGSFGPFARLEKGFHAARPSTPYLFTHLRFIQCVIVQVPLLFFFTSCPTLNLNLKLISNSMSKQFFFFVVEALTFFYI